MTEVEAHHETTVFVRIMKPIPRRKALEHGKLDRKGNAVLEIQGDEGRFEIYRGKKLADRPAVIHLVIEPFGESFSIMLMDEEGQPQIKQDALPQIFNAKQPDGFYEYHRDAE